MADTVLDLKNLLNVKLHGFKASFSGLDEDLFKILNSAQHTLWMLLLSAGRTNDGDGNWWEKEGTLTLNGVRDADLPTDFHDMAFVECTTAGWEDVQFHGLGWRKKVFQEQRRLSGTVDSSGKDRGYVISGGRPAKFHLDRVPNASIDLHIIYTYFFTDFVDDDSDIAYIPPPYRDALVNYAAAQLIASDQDLAQSSAWREFWAEHKALIATIVGTRQIADNVKSEAYDKAG